MEKYSLTYPFTWLPSQRSTGKRLGESSRLLGEREESVLAYKLTFHVSDDKCEKLMEMLHDFGVGKKFGSLHVLQVPRNAARTKSRSMTASCQACGGCC